MKKLVFVLLLYIVLCPFVMARQLEIEDIRFYLNEDRVKDISFSGTLDAKKGDAIKIKLDLFNHDNSTFEDIIFFSEIKDINDGSDVEKELTEFDLGGGDDVSKELELKVPSDAKSDDYPFYIKIRGILNGSEELTVYNYTLDVSEKPVEMTDLLLSINSSLKDIKESVSQSFINASTIAELNQNIGIKDGKIDELTSIITTKSAEIEGFKTTITDKDSQIEQLKNDKNDLNNRIGDLEPKAIELESISSDHLCSGVSVRQCVNQRIKEITDSRNVILWAVFIASAIVIYLYRRKFKPKTEIGGQKPTIEKVGFLDKLKSLR